MRKAKTLRTDRTEFKSQLYHFLAEEPFIYVYTGRRKCRALVKSVGCSCSFTNSW